jgi:hypothetical protein
MDDEPSMDLPWTMNFLPSYHQNYLKERLMHADRMDNWMARYLLLYPEDWKTEGQQVNVDPCHDAEQRIMVTSAKTCKNVVG